MNRRGKGEGSEPSAGWRLRIPLNKTLRESRKPFVRTVGTAPKAAHLPPYNTATVESYYVCAFEVLKMEVNMFPKSAVIIKMRICLTVRNSELKKFLFLKPNADASYTVQNRNFSFPSASTSEVGVVGSWSRISQKRLFTHTHPADRDTPLLVL